MMVTKNENEHEFSLPHPIWSDVEVDSVQINHKKPKSMSDRLGTVGEKRIEQTPYME